jgi:hypothetical protein
MIPAEQIECGTVSYDVPRGYKAVLPMLHTTAFEAEDGTRAQIIVNPSDEEITFKMCGKEMKAPALDALLIPLE